MDFWHDAALQKRWLHRFIGIMVVLLVPVAVLAVFEEIHINELLHGIARNAPEEEAPDGEEE